MSGLPRLLAGIPAQGALGLEGHVGIHGELRLRARARARARSRRKKDNTTHLLRRSNDQTDRSDSTDLVNLVELAGLRGRGGGGFPTAAKLRAVATVCARTRTRAVVLVNGAEGEPASSKDRTLLQALPHLVLDGAALAAHAIGADEIVIAVCQSAPPALDSVARALTERGHGSGRLARDHGEPHVQLLAVPPRYVAGQESALVSLANGGPALPAFTPPLPSERGVRRRPTLVANVETLAHLALIARHGAPWFRELGVASQPGSALITVSGVQLSDPGVYEVETGSALTALLDAAGGLRERPRAVLIGGYAGTWIDGAHLHSVAFSDEQLAPHGATLGAGVVTLLSPAACPVAELARLTRWLAAQSSRQCGPCTFGLPALADTIEQIALGSGPRQTERRLQQLAALVHGRGACSHPDGAARLVRSALEVFADDLADHARHGPCAACERPSELPRPRAASGDDFGHPHRGRPSRAAHDAHQLVGVR